MTTERDLIEEVEELLAKATPGRWYWTVNLKAKQVSLQSQDGPRQYVMDFVRYGMNGAQPRFNVEGLMQDAQDCAVIVAGREHHAAWYQTLDHPDAALIEQAPDLLRRLVEKNKRIANAFLIAFDLAGIDAHPLPEALPESAYVDGYMDKVRELRAVFALIAARVKKENHHA